MFSRLRLALFITLWQGCSGDPLRQGPSTATGDPCTARTDDVPCLHVKSCQHTSAEFGPFHVSNANGTVPAVQVTRGGICWDKRGLHVREMAFDRQVFSPYTQCNSPVFVKSDVLEVFIGPVLSPTDNPQSYFELDTSPSGAMWAGLSNNSLGNSSTCVSADGCTHAGTLPCTGAAGFPHGLTVTVANATSEGWSTSLFIPWSLFSDSFQPLKTSTGIQPWETWRANFYRYDYPSGQQGNFELTAWSPTHNPSFHRPERFGVLVLDST